MGLILLKIEPKPIAHKKIPRPFEVFSKGFGANKIAIFFQNLYFLI
ncbi:hypothetical protein M595_3292 [Lyngbya aestuarii BL J]|uniref:Uncharacterized protein n=1 Tax=Lyngbya aestuarii BL J TaxID=1348334 RepID=U7QFM2_9CYAN|nr:hypothetical protein M595_3292 [Lyngbya aestuarii BL J]